MKSKVSLLIAAILTIGPWGVMSSGNMAGALNLLDHTMRETASHSGKEVTEGSSSSGEIKPIEVRNRLGQLPLYFIENRGQKDKCVKFYAHGDGGTVFFTTEGIYFSLPDGDRQKSLSRKDKSGFAGTDTLDRITMAKLAPVGLRNGVEPTGVEPKSGRVNYLTGNEPSSWKTDIPTYGAVTYREAYSGIDLNFYGDGRQLEYDVIVKPGADLSQVKFQYRGSTKLQLLANGDLQINLPNGIALVQKRPLVYQEIDGQRVNRAGSFQIAERCSDVYGFKVAWYDKNYPLVIDPVLLYSTFLGGTSADHGRAIALDQDGNIYVTGYTKSNDFPRVNEIYSHQGDYDAFVTKINAQGTALAYSTYLGGSAEDRGQGIGIDAQGLAYVTGYTKSGDFPAVNALYASYQGGNYDAFVAKLTAAGNALVYSTYLGGKASDYGQHLAVDQDGNAYITGYTWSDNFPTHNPIYAYRAYEDVFVTKVNAGGSALVYSTYLSGRFKDLGYGIAVDPNGYAYITGWTGSDDFPTKYPLYTDKGTEDAFVTKLNPDGTSLTYSTYLGGANIDWGLAITADQDGNAYLTGYTYSDDFPTKTALYAFSGVVDAFVTKINPTGTGLCYSTYLGGSNTDNGYGIAVDDAGNCYVTGRTISNDFPTKKPLCYYKGEDDVFLSKINSEGQALVYSTYIGADKSDWAFGIAVDQNGNAFVTGETYSAVFPAPHPIYPHQGLADAFVVKVAASSVLPYILILLD